MYTYVHICTVSKKNPFLLAFLLAKFKQDITTYHKAQHSTNFVHTPLYIVYPHYVARSAAVSNLSKKQFHSCAWITFTEANYLGLRSVVLAYTQD